METEKKSASLLVMETSFFLIHAGLSNRPDKHIDVSIFASW